MPTPPLSTENLLGPYRLLRTLGQGGMGTVYLAHDPSLNRRVALKVLRLDLPTQNPNHPPKAPARAAASLAKRFLREAQSTAKLNHPHVVTIHTVGQHAARPFIVMEYLEGGSLADLLRTAGPMHWRDAANALRDALRGLAAAHHAAIIHRDIKPANLMRARDPAAGREIIKLADFGLARVVSAFSTDPDLTFPGAFVGSPSYASPEQIGGITTPILDGRADLYSLAATAFALLTGQPPFIEDDPADILQHHLDDPFPDVRTLAPTAPPEFQALIEKASRKNPAQRFTSALEMLHAVEALLQLRADIAPTAASKSRLSTTPSPPATAHANSNQSTGQSPPHARQTLLELESRLAQARQSSDSSTQLETLRSLYGLYSQLDRRQEATRTFREALALHVKMHAPSARNN